MAGSKASAPRAPDQQPSVDGRPEAEHLPVGWAALWTRPEEESEESFVPAPERWLLPSSAEGAELPEQLIHADSEELSYPISRDMLDDDFDEARKQLLGAWLHGELNSQSEALTAEASPLARHCLLQLAAWLDEHAIDEIDLRGVDLAGVDLRGAALLERFKMQGDGADEYYAQLQRKHFSAEAIGSVFTELDSVEALLVCALAQGGFADGREALMQMGAPQAALKDGTKYVLVSTAGRDGSYFAADLDPNLLLTAHLSKGAIPDLVADLPLRSVQIGTLVMTQEDRLITAFPGTPKLPSTLDLREGQQLRAGDLDALTTVLSARLDS